MADTIPPLPEGFELEGSSSDGLLEPGNIDIYNRPKVKNADGSISTVRSISANFDGREYLIPTVSDDGRILSDEDAIASFQKTGRHLGAFDTPEHATAYAESLHNQQEQYYLPNDSVPPLPDGFELEGEQKPLEIDIVGGKRESAVPAQPAGHPSVAPDGWEYGTGRDLAFGARSVIQGLGNTLGAIGGDAFNSYVVNPIARAVGAEQARPYSVEARALADQLGLPQAQTAGDRVLGDVGEALTGLGAGFGTAGVARMAANPIVAGVAQQSLQNAGAQAAATIAGSAASGATREAGGGTGAQLAAGLIGGAVPSALRSGAASASNLAARSGLTGSERRAAEVLRSEASSPLQISVVDSSIPGVQRTLGEATQDPGLMALENTIRARNRAAFDAVDTENNAARVQQLQKIAGTDADMAAAEAARSAASEGLRERAFAEGAETLLRNQRADALMLPASTGIGQLRQGIQSIARSGAGNPNVQNAANAVSRALNQTGDSVAGLYNVRKYIGDLLNGRAAGDDASARAASRELIQMRDMIDENLAARAPSFPEYLDAYRSASKPINRMEVGREVLSRASGQTPAFDALGNPILTPAGISRATNDLDAIAAKATDFKKAKASEILTPDDLNIISGVQDDLRRVALRNRSAAAGSQTAERISVGDRIARRSIAARAPWVGQFFEEFERRSNDALNEKLAYMLANPKEAKRILNSMPKAKADRTRNLLGQLAIISNVSGNKEEE